MWMEKIVGYFFFLDFSGVSLPFLFIQGGILILNFCSAFESFLIVPKSIDYFTNFFSVGRLIRLRKEKNILISRNKILLG